MNSKISDKIVLDGIAAETKTSCRVICFDEIDSTNNYAKQLLSQSNSMADTECNVLPIVIVADRQNEGRGRLGRTFYSPSGSGIYLSIIIETTIDCNDLPLLTMATAIGVRRAIENICKRSASIKWVNDLYLDNKKSCGILLESASAFSCDKTSVIIGVGINCFPGNLPDDIRDIAGYISEDDTAFSRSALAASVVDEVVSQISALDISTHSSRDAVQAMLSEYRNHCFVLGKEVTVTDFTNKKGSQSSFLARAIDISDNGGLIVEPLDGSPLITLVSGEISIRLD